MRFAKINLIVALITAIIAVAVLYFYDFKKQSEIPSIDMGSPITLYFRPDCSHCRNVEKFLEENQVSEKVPFNQKNVSNDQKNVEELMERANLCKLNPRDIGVPFLWTGEKCLSGEVEIIDFFKQQMVNSEQENKSVDCQKLKEEINSELKKLLDEANYCTSDLDCVDNMASFSCPFGCQRFLMNKNADMNIIKNTTSKYYENCPTCMYDCDMPELKPEDIVCRNKKCLIRNSENE
jgi:glutaredoxin